MRLLTALAVAALLLSAYFGFRHYLARPGGLPAGAFVTPDAATRVREGEAGRLLGVTFGGYEDLARERPGDPAALQGRIATGILLGALNAGLPEADAMVAKEVDAYLERRATLDPDGRFLQGLLERWFDQRLAPDPDPTPRSASARVWAAMCLAARGDARGLATLDEIAARGIPAPIEYFPAVRRFHPAWPGVAPLVAHALGGDDLAGRVEAGVTLLDYHALFGAGGGLVERHLARIRGDLGEMRRRLRGSANDEATELAGATAVLGMALLANRGDEEEQQLLARAEGGELRYYLPYGTYVRLARMGAGLEGFDRLSPLSARFAELESGDEQDSYFLMAAHRATKLAATGGEEYAALLDLLEVAFDGTLPGPRVLAMQVLPRLHPERGRALVARGVRGRGPFAVLAGTLADRSDDPVALFLPGIRSPQADLSAIAAASLLAREGPLPLQK
jgi:hypothetical protein